LEPRTDIDYNIHYYLEKMAEGEYELYAGLVEKGTMGETITLTIMRINMKALIFIWQVQPLQVL